MCRLLGAVLIVMIVLNPDTSSQPPSPFFQLTSVHLVDSHYCADPAKFISVLCTSLSTMLHVELPHVNILSKMDLIEQYGKLGKLRAFGFTLNKNKILTHSKNITNKDPVFLYFSEINKQATLSETYLCGHLIYHFNIFPVCSYTAFNLDFYTEVMDLTYLLDHLAADPFFKKFHRLNEKLAEVIQDYSLVSFVPLNVQVLSLTVLNGFLFVIYKHDTLSQCISNDWWNMQAKMPIYIYLNMIQTLKVEFLGLPLISKKDWAVKCTWLSSTF